VIDAEAFNQILELDDDDTHAYSKDIVAAYFAQAPDAFASMDAALTAMDLTTLADVAHFLMGSSATLGIARVAGACGRLERMEGAGGKDGDALAKILAEVRREHADAERWLRRWYEDHGQP
ncbi:signal transduction histidine kinase, partial [Mycena polygramma]